MTLHEKLAAAFLGYVTAGKFTCESLAEFAIKFIGKERGSDMHMPEHNRPGEWVKILEQLKRESGAVNVSLVFDMGGSTCRFSTEDADEEHDAEDGET